MISKVKMIMIPAIVAVGEAQFKRRTMDNEEVRMHRLRLCL